MSKRTLDVKFSIWDTQYRLRVHRDGSVTLRYPRRELRGDSATLGFGECRFYGGPAEVVRQFFAQQTRVLGADNNSGVVTIEDLVSGNYNHDVCVYAS